jgi:mRNA interferase MazF
LFDPKYVPDAGHIIKVDFDPHAGHEQGGWRRALVLSPKIYNGKTGLAVVVPTTNQAKGYPYEVPLSPGMTTTGVILSDAIKNLDWRARRAEFVEVAPAPIMKSVHGRLLALLGFAKP